MIVPEGWALSQLRSTTEAAFLLVPSNWGMQLFTFLAGPLPAIGAIVTV